MMTEIEQGLGRVEPLKRRVDPNMAALIGFFFGGIGLGIYLRSFIDFVLPLVMFLVIGALLAQAGWIGGALFAGVYGYVRAVNSNQRQGL